MNDQTQIIIMESLMVILAVSLGFVIAGAYFTHNLDTNHSLYILELNKVVQTCKASYHQTLSVRENNTAILLVLENKP